MKKEKMKNCLENAKTEEEVEACFVENSVTIQDNPYIKFRDKWDNPIDNAILDQGESVKGDEPFEHHYHSTDPENVKSIAEEGLVLDKEKKWGESLNSIYVSDLPAYAVKWQIRHLTLSGNDEIYERDDPIPLALLRVDEDACEDWRSDRISSEYGTSWSCKEDILPEEVDLRTKEGWIPIEEIKD